MSATRLAPSLLTDRVFVAIRDEIMSGSLPAGARLRLRDLAAHYGTSPIPVREAISRLEQTGLVERVPHKGAVVADLTLADLVQIYETRLVLEVEATRLGALVVNESTAARMRAEHDQLVTAVRQDRIVEALDHDEALLTMLYAAGGNEVLLGLVHDLWRRCRPYKLVGIGDPATTFDAWSHQGPLIEAAAVHDVEAATAITRSSLTTSVDRIRVQLRGRVGSETDDRDPVG